MRVVLATALRLLVVVALVCLIIPLSSHSAESLWKPFAGGVDGNSVNTMIQFNGDLIIGGQFTKAGGVEVHNAARWDGTQWHEMGSGTWNGVSQFAKTSTTLYAVGADIYGQTLVGQWNGSDWIPVPGWPPGAVDLIAAWDDKLVVAGTFDLSEFPFYVGLVIWDGVSWSYPDTGQVRMSSTWRLAQQGENLIAGPSNYFPPSFGPSDYHSFARFDGANWRPMDNGLLSGTYPSEIGWFNGKLLSLNNSYSQAFPFQAYEWQDTMWIPTTEPAFLTTDSSTLPPAHNLNGQPFGEYYFSWYTLPNMTRVPEVWDGTRWIQDIPGAYCYFEYDGKLLAGLTATSTDPNILGYRTTLDADADGIFDLTDNCPTTPNVDQSDVDKDGIGDNCDPCFACEQTVYISSVEGSYGNDTVLARTPIRIYFGLSSFSDAPLDFMVMGYKMYSPDGATWQAPTYDSLSLGWTARFKFFYFSNELLGANPVDTFGIAAVRMKTSSLGFPAAYQAPYSVLSTSFSNSDVGKTFCIDTSRFVANTQIQGPILYPCLFIPPQGTGIAPRWLGPRCFTIWDCGNKTSGNVDCDLSDRVDISDLTNLIDHLYLSGAPLCCPIEANVDGDPGVDLGDVSRLIDHLYISFNPLAPLP